MRDNSAELAAGAKLVRKNMAEGLLEQIKRERKWTCSFTLECADIDPRQWKVVVRGESYGVHIADWWTFPTEEDTATMMLLRIIK